MLTCKDYPSVTFGDRSRLSARSVLLPAAKVSTGHPHPLTSGALLNLTKYVGDDVGIVPYDSFESRINSESLPFC